MRNSGKIRATTCVAVSLSLAVVLALPALASTRGGRLGATNMTSHVYAGWVFTPKTPATSVAAQFKAPTLTCTSTTAGVSPGVALATGSAKNQQFSLAGVLYYCSGGVSHAVADAEADGKQAGAPKADVVHPGDALRATVTTSASTTTATISDTTKGHTFTWSKSGSGGTSVMEWVLTDTTAFGPIADFHSISFSGATVGGVALGSVTPAGTAYNLESSASVLQILTGGLTGTTHNAFTTTWEHS